jgi:hypothetical protein
MTEKKSTGAVRKYLTGILAAGVLLAIYSISTIAVTSFGMAVSDSTAQARGGRGGGRGARGGGWGRGGGRGRGRGFFRGGLWVPQVWCHQGWSSRRFYCGW